MSDQTRHRPGRRETILACRTVPLPFFALYTVAAAGVTWLAASWRDRRRSRRLRERGHGEKRDRDV